MRKRSAARAADPAVFLRAGDEPGARYSSGRVVLDEAFRDGRLCTRYWSTAGQVVPEMHAGTWKRDEPADGFVVAIDGRDLAGGYQWVSAELEGDRSGLRPLAHTPACAGITLAHPRSEIEVTVHTRVDGGPFLVRWLEITNRASRHAGITGAWPFGGMLWSRRIGEHLARGIATPFQLAYTHRFGWGEEGDFWFEPLAAGLVRVDGGRLGRSGWGRPAFWARDIVNGQTFVCELAWGGSYQFSLDCRVHRQARQAKLFFRMGLSGQDPVLRVLAPGETVRTPAVHLALFHGDVDSIVQATHAHVRSVVMPEQLPDRHGEIEANHRGYLCDQENEPGLERDEEVAAAIGAEMYVIDAGWFGNDPNRWWKNVGDWRPGSWLPNGLEPIVRHARKLGMRFGLWMEIEAAGEASTLRAEHPEWLLKRNGKPTNGRALDFSNPEVVQWAESEVERVVGRYRLDMFRIDHNHLLAPAGNRRIAGYIEDLTWRYYEGLFGMLGRLRRTFPDVLFQNCAGGGGRLDWGTLAFFHCSELSDWMRMPRGLRIFNGVTMSLPPEVLLRTFGTEAGEHELDGDVDSQLRMVCLARPIFRGIAPSREELTPFLAERIDHYLDLYRSFLRPLLADCRLFHHTPFLPIYGHAPWCVLEYTSRDARRGAAALFRTSHAGPDEYLFRPRGLREDLSYRSTSDNSGRSFVASGSSLARDGIGVRLSSPMSSELILFWAV